MDCHIIWPHMTGLCQCEKYSNWQQIQTWSRSKNSLLSQWQYLGSYQKLVRGLRILPGHWNYFLFIFFLLHNNIRLKEFQHTMLRSPDILPYQINWSNGRLSKTITIRNPLLDFECLSTGTHGIAACQGRSGDCGKVWCLINDAGLFCHS